MNTRASVACAAASLAIVAACGDGGGAAAAAEAAVTRDSGGIRIVESTGPAWTPRTALTVATEPTLAIGELDGAPEYQLYRVRAATRLGDGTLAIFDGGSQELRFYDSTGTFLRRVGGKGGGPGEYQRLTWLRRLPGDSLMLNDSDAQRMTVLAPDGTMIRSINLAAAPVEGESRVTVGGHTRYSVIGPMSDGSLLATTSGTPSERRPGYTVKRDRDTYVRLTADGALRDTLATLAGDEEQSSLGGTEGRRIALVGPPPFGRQSHVALDAGGFWFGSGDSYELQHRAADGTLDRVIRRAVEPIAVTPAITDPAKDQELARSANAPPEARAMLRPMIEERWASATMPATMPAHGAIEVDDAGRLWVAETSVPDDTIPRWTAFDADGRMLGTVDMPAGFRVLEFGAGYVLGVWTDENGVEQVRLYPLRRVDEA